MCTEKMGFDVAVAVAVAAVVATVAVAAATLLALSFFRSPKFALRFHVFAQLAALLVSNTTRTASFSFSHFLCETLLKLSVFARASGKRIARAQE